MVSPLETELIVPGETEPSAEPPPIKVRKIANAIQASRSFMFTLSIHPEKTLRHKNRPQLDYDSGLKLSIWVYNRMTLLEQALKSKAQLLSTAWMMKKKNFSVIVSISLFLFVVFVPIIPQSVGSVYLVAILRGECIGGAVSSQVTIYVSVSYSAFNDYGTIYIPKGIPYSSDNASLILEPLASDRTIMCG